MLIEALCRYADERMELPPPGYRKQSIHYVVDLDTEGNFQSISKTGTRAQSQPGLGLQAPYLKRQGNKPPPVPFADLAGRTLGLAYREGKDAWCKERHAEYAKLIAECALETGEPLVQAILRFLKTGLDSIDPFPSDFDPDGLLTFRVDGQFPSDLEAVRAFWAGRTGAQDNAASRCAVCGRHRPIVRIHPLKIKGVVGGQSGGTDLISANKNAWWSYGLENSLIFPTCYDCAWKYANALNALLATPENHLRLAGADYVFWTTSEAGFNAARLLSEPGAQEVAELIASPITARSAATAIEAANFFAVAVSGSGARTCVRSWLSTTVEVARKQISRYFALQALEFPDGRPSEPLGIWRLARALFERQSDGQMMRKGADALVLLALEGRPLPQFILDLAVKRCQAGQGVTRERAALIKMALASQGQWSHERTIAMSGLNTENHDPAYLCGRLLAELNEIQRRSIGRANATVIDRFYGSASSAPASVFGNLLDNAQNHLSKLRKTGSKAEAAAIAMDVRLMEIMEGLGSFPKTLTMPEQAMFALGFYHQKAANRRAAREHGQGFGDTDEPDEGSDESAPSENT